MNVHFCRKLEIKNMAAIEILLGHFTQLGIFLGNDYYSNAARVYLTLFPWQPSKLVMTSESDGWPVG